MNQRMSPIEDKDKYVVYTGIEDGAATFALYERTSDRDKGVRSLAMPPEDVPAEPENGDHFWVDLDENGEIEDLYFDEEFTNKKEDKYQETVNEFKKLQERDRKKIDENDDV